MGSPRLGVVAAALVATVALDEKDDRDSSPLLGALSDRIDEWFSSRDDNAALTSLSLVRSAPDSRLAVAELAHCVNAAAEDDPTSANEVATLLDEALAAWPLSLRPSALLPVPLTFSVGQPASDHQEERVLENRLAFLQTTSLLRNVARQTRLSRTGRQESAAEHSWHLALSAYALADYAVEPINVPLVALTCLAHDLVEIYAGDTFVYATDQMATREKRESMAANIIFSDRNDPLISELGRLWEEFERRSTPEGRFAHALDIAHPILINFWADGGSWIKHQVNAHQVRLRLESVYDYAPELVGYCSSLVGLAVDRGWLQP